MPAQKQYVDYNPYQGMVVSHKVQHVFLRGQKIIEDSKHLRQMYRPATIYYQEHIGQIGFSPALVYLSSLYTDG